MKFRVSTSVIALCAASTAPALADVTAADVWANQQALYSSSGLTLSGQVNGDELVAPQFSAILPQGIASFQVSTDATIAMVSNSDGTVTITYPSPMTLSFAGGVAGEGSITADLVMTHAGYTVTASGQPADISYDYNAQSMQFDVEDISFDGADEMEFIGHFEVDEWVGTSRVTVGNLVNYVTKATIGATTAEYRMNIGGVVATNTQATAPMQSGLTASLPLGGSDIMNLSAAFRDGLSILAESTSGQTESTSETTFDGSVTNRQSTSVGPQTASFSINSDGLKATAEANSFTMSMMEPMIFPGELGFGADALTMTYDIPLNASVDVQNFRAATSLSGVTIDDTLWNMVDPSGQLPRDPAEVSFDITGSGTNGMDLLDVMALSTLMGPPPIQVDDVTIENLRIAAVGAELTAQGAMTFDWTDMQTIPGIARPEGTVTVNLNGANALLDKLSAMGLVPEEDMMMPRMMMGMFATPVGDDMLETVLEVNSEGHVIANGQRIQ